LDASDGSELWQAERSGGSFSAPALVDDVLYVGFEGDVATDSGIFAFDAAEGTELWRVTADAWVTSVLVSGGMIFAVGHTGVSAFADRAADP
jgi:outer membrane protein assembly factor BamB